MNELTSTYQIETDISPGGIKELQAIERAARTCYKSEGYILEDGESAKRIVGRLIWSGHTAMLEHGGMTVRFICDRGVSHELVRHRLTSFAQESTRYCNYSKGKFSNSISVIKPVCIELGTQVFDIWEKACKNAEASYMELIRLGVQPQTARSVLPTCLKTEVVVTANWREWRKIFMLRTAPDAHPDIQDLMNRLLKEMKERVPVLFDDITY